MLGGTTVLEPATSCVTGMRSTQPNYVPVHRSEEWPGDTGERARIACGMAEQNIPRVHGPTVYSRTAWARRTRGPPVADRRRWTLTSRHLSLGKAREWWAVSGSNG